MNPRRCGFGVPLEQLPDGDRQVVEDFKRWLAGELAIAEDGITYVQPDDPRATYFGYRKGLNEPPPARMQTEPGA